MRHPPRGGEKADDARAYPPYRLHPTQKPEALPHRIVLAGTNAGEVLLDPFLGSGTSSAVAKRLHRHFIGIERHPAYVEAAWGRVRRVKKLAAGVVEPTPSRRDAPRWRSAVWWSGGVVAAGTVLVDKQRRVAAVVGADGTLVCGPHRRSIYQVGAAVRNAPSCNGWTFWFFEREGVLVALDSLRAPG